MACVSGEVDLTRHDLIETDDARIHVASTGEGDRVVLVHGFPDTWRTWSQLAPLLARQGFEAVATDTRGCGRSVALDGHYGILSLAADIRAVIGDRPAHLVGHDWGAQAAFVTALAHPDVVRSVAGIGTPFMPPGSRPPSADLAALDSETHELYLNYFLRSEEAAAEIAADPHGWLHGLFASAAANRLPLARARGRRFCDEFTSGPLPPWLADGELRAVADELAANGADAALGPYRHLDRDFEQLRELAPYEIECPALYIVGSGDETRAFTADAEARLERYLRDLRGVHVVDGGHWVHRDQPAAVAELLASFWAASSAFQSS